MATDFEWLQFQDTTYGLTHLPQSTNLFVETTLYIYYVSTDDNKQLWKYTKSTGTDAQVDVDPGDAWGGDDKSRPQNIKACYYERTGGIIYFVDFGANAGYIWSIDISDDTVAEVATITEEYTTLENIFDIVYIEDESVVRVIGSEYKDNPVVDYYYITVYDGNGFFLCSYQINYVESSTNATHAYSDGTDFFFVVDTSAAGLPNHILKYNFALGSLSSLYSFGNETSKLSTNDNLLFATYDGSDRLYFYYDSKLQYYSFTGDDVTALGNINVGMMLDRNCLSTSGSPWEHEKGFHITSPYIYQITRGYEYILKIQDLGLTGGATISAISDTYLIDSNKNVYSYTDQISDVVSATCLYSCWTYPSGRFEYSDQLSSDQLIEIWQNASGTYTLAFRGKAGTPTYNTKNRNRTYIFKPKNLGWADLFQRITYSASATGGDETVIALLGQLTNPYLYADATSIPNIATTITYEFDDIPLIEALYICCILLNGYFWFEPSGYFYFRTWSGKPDSGDTFSQATGDIGPPNAIISKIIFNTFDIRGGWDDTTGAPYISLETDADHIREFGPLEWNGRSHFPGAQSQAALDAISAALEAWQGMQDNPTLWKGAVLGKYYYPVGYYASLQYTGRDEFATATDMLLIRNSTNFKRPGKIICAFTTSLVHKGSSGGINESVSLIKQSLTSQHNREVSPETVVPENGLTSGNNNCYWDSRRVTFGTTAKAGGGELTVKVRVPSDYVDGENATMYIWWRINRASGGSETVDYTISYYYFADAAVIVLANTDTSTWTGADNNASNKESSTITGTNLTAGMTLEARIKMEDDDNNTVVWIDGLYFEFPVNTRM